MSFDAIRSMFGNTASGPRIEVIAAATATQFHADGETVFVDVRNPGELAASGTVEGAIRAPLAEFADHAKPDGSGTLPAVSSGKRIICICASGARSGAAAQQLIAMGYKDVGNVRGGFAAWRMAGGKVEV